ncbi:MAG: hypothetical protein R3264_15805, partial [Anaerolineae bacterium]|nr:hypothetical protein [Anaerolineae bacterium]
GKRLERKSDPNQGAWLSIKNALRVGLFGGAIFGLYYALLFNSSSGLLVFAIGSLGSGAVFGGLNVAKHFLVRLMLWYCGHLPWNYARFLDHAAERVLLRKIGGGYIFVHRLLQEHFADLASLDDASTGASGGELKNKSGKGRLQSVAKPATALDPERDLQ